MGNYITLDGHRTRDGSVDPFIGWLVTVPIDAQLASDVLCMFKEKYGLKIHPSPYDVGRRRLASYTINSSRISNQRPNLIKVGSRIGSLIAYANNGH